MSEKTDFYDYQHARDTLLNDYGGALQTAGAIVHDIAYFGDYQGTWYALVTYKGREGLAYGYFGSCSGCDSFQDEFSFWNEHTPEEWDRKLREFGESYLNDLMSIDEAMDRAGKDLGTWHDDETAEMLTWLRGLKERHPNA